MKTKLNLLATAVLAATLTITGCATSPQTQQRAQTAAKLAAYVGGSEYLRAHPETRPAFVLARDQLKAIEQAETVDLTTLLAIVNQLPVKELKSDRAQMLVTAATIILADYAGALPLEKLNDLKPVAQAIREGLDLVLQ